MNNINDLKYNAQKLVRFQILTTFLTGIIISFCLTCTTFSYILTNHSFNTNILPIIYIVLLSSVGFIMFINISIYIFNLFKIQALSSIQKYKQTYLLYLLYDVWFFLLIIILTIFNFQLFTFNSYHLLYIFVIILFFQLILSIIFIANNVKFLIKYLKIINEILDLKKIDNNYSLIKE